MRRFRRAFPATTTTPTLDQVKEALAAYIRSIPAQTSAFDAARDRQMQLSSEAERGKQLFDGPAGCSECHRLGGEASFTDQEYHHSGIGNATQSESLPEISQSVIDENLDPASIGPRVLRASNWSALGRFVVSHNPADIGAFRTPSLRNVAATAPYMHDGSIATLSDAVDHEIYYRGFSRDRPLNVTSAERRSIVVFLETLTDEPYAQSAATARSK
jgi:cytochrome c peroxidase